MNDADLELTISNWLEADAGALRAPSGLRRRVQDLPAQPMPATHWWHRFASLPAMSGVVVSAGAVGVLVASMFFGLFDTPAGTDGEPCNNRQVQHAIDNLRDAEGYRYVNREQLRQLDPDAELSFDDPAYRWTDGWVSEGAYLAPDRARDVRTFSLPALYNRGYSEAVHAGGARYELQDIDGAPTWVRSTNWPTANQAYGYLMGAFPTFSIPGVNSLDFGGTPVPAELPGTNGCIIAARIPGVDPGVPTAIHIEQRIVALRIDVAAERPTAIYLGPEVGEPESDGQAMSTWELTWTTPPSNEFVVPTEWIEDPNAPGAQQSFEPPPTASPIAFDASAWAPVDLPVTPPAMLNGVVAGAGRFVAVGSTYEDNTPSGLVWTSTDGTSWEAVDGPVGFNGMDLSRVAWNGSTFLAVGSRNYDSPDGPQFSSAQPEAWLSTDGLTWELGGPIGPDVAGGEVANLGLPVPAGPGWVAGGSIWSLADNQQRPAIFTSPDGARWTTAELEGTGSGSLGQIVVLPDGTFMAAGCESPGPTNPVQSGDGCYSRPWRSSDGEAWAPGPIWDVDIGAMVVWGDKLIAVGSEAGSQQQAEPWTATATLFESTDGNEWTPMSNQPPGQGLPINLTVVGDALLLDGQILLEGRSYPIGTEWRSLDGETWEPISLAMPEGGDGSWVSGAVATPTGLAFLGQVQIGETSSQAVIWREPPLD